MSTIDNQQPAQDGSAQPTPVEIRTVNLDAAGLVGVVLDYGSTPLLLVADAAAQVALELLSAAYAARAEMALQAKLKEARLDM